MAGPVRSYRILDLERDPLTATDAQTRAVLKGIRERERAARRSRAPSEPVEPPRITLSRGWDRKAEKPIR